MQRIIKFREITADDGSFTRMDYFDPQIQKGWNAVYKPDARQFAHDALIGKMQEFYSDKGGIPETVVRAEPNDPIYC